MISDTQQLGKNVEMASHHAHCITLGVTNRNTKFSTVWYYHNKSCTMITHLGSLIEEATTVHNIMSDDFIVLFIMKLTV